MIELKVELSNNIKELFLVDDIIEKDLLSKIPLNTLGEAWRTEQLIKITYDYKYSDKHKLYVCPFCGWTGTNYSIMCHHFTLCCNCQKFEREHHQRLRKARGIKY